MVIKTVATRETSAEAREDIKIVGSCCTINCGLTPEG